jgi:hypothetical protein
MILDEIIQIVTAISIRYLERDFAESRARFSASRSRECPFRRELWRQTFIVEEEAALMVRPRKAWRSQWAPIPKKQSSSPAGRALSAPTYAIA